MGFVSNRREKRKIRRQQQKEKEEKRFRSKWMDVDLESMSCEEFDKVKWDLRANYSARIICGVLLTIACIFAMLKL